MNKPGFFLVCACRSNCTREKKRKGFAGWFLTGSVLILKVCHGESLILPGSLKLGSRTIWLLSVVAYGLLN